MTESRQKDDELILTGYATSQTGFGLMATNPGKSSGWNSNPVVDVAPWEDFPMRNTLPNVRNFDEILLTIVRSSTPWVELP
jgi:hypothetical protein